MISLILVILAAIFNSIMDVISLKYEKSRFINYPNLRYFIDPEISWKNKYKNNIPKRGEKFFGSSTFLVWTTDLWHLAKTLMLVCFSIAIITYIPIIHPIVDAIIYWVIFGVIFELFWSKIFIK